ncbi:MAG: T9SS type A sorting domain-containing protein, partial [Sphingobacteriales bacterium]
GYSWSDGSGVIGATSPLVTYPAMTTNYTATLTDANGCSMTSAPLTVTVSPVTALAVTGTSAVFNHLDGLEYMYTDASCNLIAKVEEAAGGNVLSGVNASVTVDATVQTALNGDPFLQRHFNITPASNGSAVVTLYATQAEFDAYNNVAGAYPLLPAGGIDNGNVRVTKFTGATVGSGTATLIVPTSVVWNSTNSWWEITAPVSGFSSFYIHTGVNPLLVKLLDIQAINTGNENLVSWSTSSETAGDYFEIERSDNGSVFETLAMIPAGNRSGEYRYTDIAPIPGINYYRLRMLDAGGRFTYSKVVSATMKASDELVLKAYPNPVKDVLTVQLSGSLQIDGTITITDATGKMLLSRDVTTGTYQIPMQALSSGIYFLNYSSGELKRSVKIS